jgi:phosphatidylserine decarboxylase
VVVHLLIGIAIALLTTLPLAWKWQLGMRRVAAVVALLGGAWAIAVWLAASPAGIGSVAGAALVWLLTVASASGLLAYRFYRDPERTPPNRADAIVSPADGEVIYVRQSRGGVLPVSTKAGREYSLRELTKTPLASKDVVVIGISMSFLDVHVNRAPIAGRVSSQRHFPGLFGSLRRPEMIFENERATTVLERDGLEVAVVQIASRLVRRIVAFVHPGDFVTAGQRIGAIRLGSQVDIVLPARSDVTLTVAPGERVTAGESVIAVLAPASIPESRKPLGEFSRAPREFA